MRVNMDEGAKRELRRSIQNDASQLRYDSSEHDLGVRVIEAVGAAVGIDETEITTPLSDVVDPEALNALFDDETSGQVSFQFVGYRITVSVFEDSSGRIYVE
jgi:hypothetical protein